VREVQARGRGTGSPAGPAAAGPGSHPQAPGAVAGELQIRALDALLAQLHTQKHAATARPRPGRAWPEPRRSSSRHIPAAVRRAVWARDGGRCAFVADDGRRCAALDFLEFHHVVPYARGGPAIADNLELRCRAHNGYEATRQMARWHTDEVREAPAGYSPDVLGRERDAGAAAGARLLNSPRGEFDVHGHTIGQLARGQSVR
jgi:5-methylcytosine-specific restriction endonuclease McrA